MLDAREARTLTGGAATDTEGTFTQVRHASQARYRRIQLAVQELVPQHLAAIDLAVRAACEEIGRCRKGPHSIAHDVVAPVEAIAQVTDGVVAQVEARGYAVRTAGAAQPIEGLPDRLRRPLVVMW